MINKAAEFIKYICDNTDNIYNNIDSKSKEIYLNAFASRSALFEYNNKLEVNNQKLPNSAFTFVFNNFYNVDYNNASALLYDEEFLDTIHQTDYMRYLLFLKSNDVLIFNKNIQDILHRKLCRDEVLCAMNDPFNPTDKEIEDFLLISGDVCYDMIKFVWSDRAIDILIKLINTNKVTNIDKYITDELYMDLLNKIDIKNVNYNTIFACNKCTVDQYYELLNNNFEYIKYLPKLITNWKYDIVTQIVENKTYNSFFKLATIIADICNKKTISAARSAKLKSYVFLIKVFNYDYLQIMKSIYDQLQDEKLKNRLKYIVCNKDQSFKIFESEKEMEDYCKNLDKDSYYKYYANQINQ